MTENTEIETDTGCGCYEQADDTSKFSWDAFSPGMLAGAIIVGLLGACYGSHEYKVGRIDGYHSAFEEIQCQTDKCQIDDARTKLEVAKIDKQTNDVLLEQALASTKEQAAANKIIWDSMPNGTKLSDTDLYFLINAERERNVSWVGIPAGTPISLINGTATLDVGGGSSGMTIGAH